MLVKDFAKTVVRAPVAFLLLTTIRETDGDYHRSYQVWA